MPGASGDMNTIQLIKNWQTQKSKDSQRMEELRERARQQAQPEIERVIIERYKQEEIMKATQPKSERAKQVLKDGLGIDSDKVFGRENIDRITGNRHINTPESGIDSNKVFSQDRIDRMAGHNSMNQDSIKRAAGNVNWDKGVRRGLDSGTEFNGLDKALGRDRPKKQ